MADRIVVGADHAGFELKTRVVEYLEGNGFEVTDVGCHSADSVDYPKFGYAVAKAMQDDNIPRGILCCGSGIGVCMAANRFPHVRAVVARDINDAVLSRRHNNANVLCLGGRVTAAPFALDILKTWLETPFDGGRHEQRVQQLGFDVSDTKEVGQC